MSLDSFYYKLLHLTPNAFTTSDIIHKIEEAIKEEMNLIQDKSATVEGLCKVASCNIGENLKEKGISVHYVNTKDFSCMYEHVALLVYYEVDSQMKYILIDTTFEQFLPVENRQLHPKLKEWPSVILKEKNFQMYEALCKRGYSYIEVKDWNDYLQCFHPTYHLNGDLFDIVLENHKKR